MDGKGRFLDNIYIERLWRSLEYECVYLHAFSGGCEARAGIGRWIDFYNHHRPHAAHGGRTPALVYQNSLSTGGSGAHSDAKRPLIAIQNGQCFRFNPATDSDAKRPL
jgi:putative transposase